MQHIILQACRMDRWIAGDWHQCVLEPVPGLVSDGIFGLFVAIALYGGLYLAGGGKSTTPTVVTILVASVMFATLPAAYRGLAWSVLLLGGAAALIQAFQKYMLDPTTS